MCPDLYGKDLITTQEWSLEELESVLDLAVEMKRNPLKFSSKLRGKSLVMLFFNDTIWKAIQIV